MQDIIIHAIGRTLLHSLWQGMLLTLLAGLLMIITRKSTAALRYNLLTVLLMAFAITVSITFYLQLSLINKSNNLVDMAHGANTVKSIIIAGTYTAGTFSLQQAIAAITDYFDAHAASIVLIWFCIFLAKFVKIMSGLTNIQRIRHYGISRVNTGWDERLEILRKRLQISKPVLLLESTILKIPVVLGWLKPVILVPAGMLANLDTLQVEAILLHELAHIRRRDYLINVIQRVMDTVFFFNPAVLWVSSLLRSERESCCDDIAIRETGSRKLFIEALVSFYKPLPAGSSRATGFSNRPKGFALSFAGAKKHQLLDRVRRIVDKRNPALQSGERWAMVTLLLVTGAAFVTISSSKPSVIKSNPVNAIAVNIQLPADSSFPSIRPGLRKIIQVATRTATLKQLHSIPEMQHVVEEPQADQHLTEENTQTETQHHEIDNYRLQLQQLGFREPGDDRQLQEYLDHGLNAGYIEAFQKAGYNGVSLPEFLEMQDHGVSMDFINGFKSIGYANVSLHTAMDLIDHGVTKNYIQGFFKLGFTTISLEQAIELQDHGLNSGYIKAIQKKTGTMLTLEEYIRLKDSGVNLS